jgi:Flp pilus assembly protein TadD
MTSSRNRRTRASLPWRRIAVFTGALGAFGVAIYAWFFLSPVRIDPAASQAAVQRSAGLLAAYNYTGAQAAALDAVRSDPDSPEAHLLLARAKLALEDGLGAEAELRRAMDAGLDKKLVPHLMAHALLLQGEAEKAADEVEHTDPRFRPYGLRVRARALSALGNLAGANAALAEAMRIAPKDSDVWTDAGRFRFTAGDLIGAIEASEQAVKLNPANIDALVLRGELVRTQYGLVASLPWFERALQRDPNNHDALIEYASTLGDAGRANDMLAVTRRAIAVKTGSPQAYYLQAVLAARAGNYDLARSLYGRTGGLDVPGSLLLGGTLDIQAGDYEQAIEKLRALVGQQPMNITARKLLAVALLRTDAARNALDVLRPVALRSDADSYTLGLVARGFERIGDRGNAARFLDRAATPVIGEALPFAAADSVAVLAAPAQERPGDPSAVIPLIRAFIDRGDRAAALARAQQVAAANPGAASAHVVLGDVLMLQDRYGDAATAYARAAALRFDEPTMLRLLEAQDRAGRRSDAANTLALFLSQNPANPAALRISAQWQLASGDFDAAIDTLEGLRVRLGDRDASLNAELSAAYAAAGEQADAERYGLAAYLLAPSNPAAADAYGWALFEGGDLNGARELVVKAVQLAPQHSGLRWHLAQIYAGMNRKAEAKAQLQLALADPRFPDRAAANVLIGKLG